MQIIEDTLITAVVVIGGIWLVRAFFWQAVRNWAFGPRDFGASDLDSSDGGWFSFGSSDTSDSSDSSSND